MQPNDFKYTLLIGDKEFDLLQSPTGWDENLINYKRDSYYKGLIASFTLPLDFVTDGAKIIRSQYYQYGIEAQVRLRISKLDTKTWTYSELFYGELDFENYQDNDYTVSINVVEAGLRQNIKAYDNVKYDIELNVDEAVNVTIPGIGLNDYSNSIINTSTGINFFPSIDLVINQLLSGQVTAQNTLAVNGPNVDTSQWFAKANVAGLSIRIKGNINASLFFDTFGTCEIKIISTIGTGPTFLVKQIYKRTYQGLDTVNIDFDFNVTTSIDQRFYFQFLMNGFSNSEEINEGRIDISYSTASTPLTIKMLKPKYLLEQILTKINGNRAVTVNSFLLDNSRVLLTSGSGIRSLSGAKIKTTLKDFFKSFDAVYGIGLGIVNGEVIFEQMPYFFTEIVSIANIGEIKEVIFEPAKEYIFSSLKLGYKNQEYQQVEGIDEFNSDQSWTFPIRKSSNALDLVSEYRADTRGIDEIRKKLLDTNQTTTDIESDNDTFMIKVKDDYSAPEGMEAYTLISGVSNADKIFNYFLSPKKNLLRNIPLISSFLSNLNGTQIRFQSAAKNANLQTIDLNGVNVKENVNINVDDYLSNRLFYPLIANFKAKLPLDLPKAIQNNPYGSITFTYNNNQYKGFILECSIDASRNTEREFKLLLSASNDLTKLIR